MTDYLMLIRNQGDPMAGLSPDEMNEHLAQWGAWMGGLAQAGRLRSGHPLGDEAACVGRDVIADGPYAETKDVIGGYVIVACDSLEQAIATARACPSVELGSLIEVRVTVPNILE